MNIDPPRLRPLLAGLSAAIVGLTLAGCPFDLEDLVDEEPDAAGPVVRADAGRPDAGAGVGEDAGTPDAGAPPAMTECSPPTGPGTEHNREITSDEVWTAAASPHRVTFGIRLLATVRVEACATVLVGEGYTLLVGAAGKPGALIARGERGLDAQGNPVRRPVTFAAADPSRPWGSITVWDTGTLDLETVDLRDPANPDSDQNGGGAIVAWGKGRDATEVTRNVRAVDLVIERARGYGFNFLPLAGFAEGSRNIAVRGGGRAAAAFPVRLALGAVSTLPPQLSLSGNAADEVQIVADNTGMISDTVRARGLPYRVTGRVRVAPSSDGPPVTLTVEPGVTLRFEQGVDSGLQVGTSSLRQGLLVAAGSATAPILFTSAKPTPAPGDWKNLYFFHTPPTGNRIEHAVVEYAGGASGAQGYGCGPIENDASLLILSERPSEAFVRDTLFRNGAGDTGILLGWVSDLDGPDFVSPNQFVAMPACRVSRWKNATGVACPGSVGGAPLCL